jgi:hypothetical protein
MGASLASCRDPKRTTGKKRYSAGAARAVPKRDAAAGKTAIKAGDTRRQPEPHRSEADLELARRMLDALRRGADMRLRKVRRLKAAIKVRAYENNLKFQVAFDRLRATAVTPWIALNPKLEFRVSSSKEAATAPSTGSNHMHSPITRPSSSKRRSQPQ